MVIQIIVEMPNKVVVQRKLSMDCGYVILLFKLKRTIRISVLTWASFLAYPAVNITILT